MPQGQLSERRLAANRANALKSTGPRTPEGKRKSAQNACRHRLYSRKQLLSDKAAAYFHERAVRYAAQFSDPVLGDLRYRLSMASGRCEYIWSLWDALYAHAHRIYPGDPHMAIWFVLHQPGYLLALHRNESIYTRAFDAIVKAIEQYEKQQKQPASRRAPRPQPQNLKQQTHFAALRTTLSATSPSASSPMSPSARMGLEPRQTAPAPQPHPQILKQQTHSTPCRRRSTPPAAPQNLMQRTHSPPLHP